MYVYLTSTSYISIKMCEEADRTCSFLPAHSLICCAFTEFSSTIDSSVWVLGSKDFVVKVVSVRVCSRRVQHIIGRCRCIGMVAVLIICM